MRTQIALLLCALCLSSAGCTWFRTDVQRGYEERGHLDGARIYTTADIRVVSQRQHPVTHQLVTCTEPTPDVAKALSTASQISLQGGNKAASGQIGLSGASAEAVAELAGRSTALLALRDGLFRACEAYENGAIGADAYSLVLSRYGQLMTTLFLGEDIQGAARAAATASSPPAPAPAPGGNAAAGGNQNGTNAGGEGASSTKQDPTHKATKRKNTSRTPTEPDPVGLTRIATVSSTDTTLTDSDHLPRGALSASPPKPKPKPKNKPQASPTDTPPPTPDKPQAATADSKSASTSNADALVRLNQGYFDLDTHLVHLLVVACINEFDNTRKRTPNPWLQTLCESMKDVKSIMALQSATNPPEQNTPPSSPTPTHASGQSSSTPDAVIVAADGG